ncbi:MAG: prealbumin-like fold domain-containing protein [Peptoniphilaceae bacterium]|nr:prealbumin-like fold domain-containing protein [Peptoniphilaceae bacterium]MDY6018518.1 prealbumin-like fold domain-containing protein [Anaerococcus sp.]
MNDFLKHLKEILKDKANRKKMKKVFCLLAFLVFLITSFALKVPAMTLEKDQAEKKSILIEDSDFTYDKATSAKTNDDDIDQNANVEENPENAQLLEENKTNDSNSKEEVRENEDLNFTSEAGPIRAEVTVKDTNISSDSTLVVNSINENLPKVSFFAAKKAQTLNSKDEQIENLIDGQISEIKYIDISFFDKEGNYLPVENAAKVSLDIESLQMEKSEDEDISIVHFAANGPEVYSPQIRTDQDGKVEEVSFDTQGFSVFAIVKHGTWKRIQVDDNLYTILTSNTSPNTLEYDSNNIITKTADISNDFVKVSAREGTESPYDFKNSESSQKYKRFIIKNAGNNEYTIRAADFNKYLAIANNRLILSDQPYRFVFYENSKDPGNIQIHGQSLNDKPQIVVFDKATNDFKIVNTYTDLTSYQSSFLIARNRLYYRVVRKNELSQMPNVGRFVIISDNDQTRNVERGFSTDSLLTNPDKRDSVQLYRDGLVYTAVEDTLVAKNDQLYKERIKEPTLLTFTKVPNKENTFYIQDENGNYLKYEQSSFGKILFGNEKVETTIISVGNDDEVYLKQGNNSYLNLDTNTFGFHVWNATPSNSRVKIAFLQDDTFVGNYNSEDKLVDAIIPDGYYALTNEDGSKLIKARNTSSYLYSSDAYDLSDKIYSASTNKYPSDQEIYQINRQKDGTYRITSCWSPSYYLQITDITQNSEYNSLALRKTIQETDSESIKISTTEQDPSLFYLYNQYGYLSTSQDSSRWVSKVGSFSSPLRLYRIDDIDTFSNKRFIHQEKQPTEELADITDGDYVLGHGREDFTKTKTDFKVLDKLLKVQDAYIYYDDDFKNNLPLVEAVNKDVELDQWKIVQTSTPGSYNISKTVHDQATGKDYTINLSLTDYGTNANSLGTGPGSLKIYKANDGNVLKVFITDGINKLRYKDGKFISVPVSEPLEEGDYHYLGKKVSDYLKFKLTTPTAYGANAKWDKNVRMQERILVNDLKNEDGTFSLSKALPKGYAEDLGPIGEIYAKKQDFPSDNPYKNLYRLNLPSDEGLPANISKASLTDPYAEYKFIGYSAAVNGKKYVIYKDAKFEKAVQSLEGKDVAGIKIKKEGLSIVEDTGSKPSETKASEDLFIPFESDITLETIFVELSTPLYFYFNPWSGIFDVERGIQAQEIIAREDTNIKNTKANLSPLMAEGRILFPNATLAPNPLDNSTCTNDSKLKDLFKNVLNVEFPETYGDFVEDKYKNQIVFKNISDSSGKLVSNDYSIANPMTSNKIKNASIEWLKNNSSKAGILKYAISTKGKTPQEILDDQTEIQNINKDNIDIENVGIDYLDLKKTNGGLVLRGVLYAYTKIISAEKYFENVNDTELERLRKGTDNQGTDKFQINILIDSDSNKAKPKVEDFKTSLYNLSFDRVNDSGESGSIQKTRKPTIGDLPLTYWDIERVGTSYDKENRHVTWSLPVLADMDFVIEETGAQSGPLEKDLYVKTEAYAYDQNKEESSNYYYKASDLKNMTTRGIRIKEVLNSNKYYMVGFTNHYSSKGTVKVKSTVSLTGNPLMGRTYVLYKLENGIERQIQEATSLSNGLATFSDLDPGKYRLKEANPDPLYEEIGQIDFSIKDENGSYLIEGSPPANVDFVASKTSDDTLMVENTINIKYKNKTKALTIIKDFVGTSITEISDILSNDSKFSPNEFKILVKGYDKNNKEIAESSLNYENSLGLVLKRRLRWQIDSLNSLDNKADTIDLFASDGKLNPVLDHISIEEEGYNHERFPVVKRKAKFDGNDLPRRQYPYKITNDDLKEDGKRIFELTNIYTDVFDLVVQVLGKDYQKEKFIPVSDMGFKLYGSIDESDGLAYKDFGQDGIWYLLKKPIVEFPDKANDADYSKEFFTDKNGQEQIFKLAMYEGNKYILEQSFNPNDTKDEKDLIYYALERPLEIEVVKDSNNELKAQLKNGASNDYSVDGKYKISYAEDGGTLFITIRLDRSNYKLPDTGGLGENRIYKVGTIMIIMATTLLIYKNKKRRII